MMWFASSSARLAGARRAVPYLSLALLLACDEPDKAPHTGTTPPASSVAPALRATLDAAAIGSEPSRSDAGLALEPATHGLPLSREELLLQLLEPDLSRWTTDAVRERFATLGLQRSEPLPGSLQWVVHTPREHLQFNYLPDERGGFRFADVSLEMPTESAAEARSAYKKYAALLQKKLGKPTWVKDDPRYRARGYKLGGQLDVSLGAVATTEDSQPYLAFSIAAPQNQSD